LKSAALEGALADARRQETLQQLFHKIDSKQTNGN